MNRPLSHLSIKELKHIINTKLPPDVNGIRKHGEQSPEQINAIAELDEKRMRRSIHLTLLVGFLAVIFAAIASWPVIREWFRSSPPAPSTVVSQPSQSHSIPTTQTQPKRSISHNQ